MGWAFFFMMVVLKIPILALAWIVWWAWRSEPRPEEDPSDGGGGIGPHRPRPRRPSPPRRGPHAGPPPSAPPRVRARSRVGGLREPPHTVRSPLG